MGRGHGATRGSSPGGGASRGFGGDVTMRGYSDTLGGVVSSAEAGIKDSEYENAFVFDQQGNLVYKSADVGTTVYSSNAKTNALQQKLEQVQRKKSVYVPPQHVNNNVVTHNHPNNDSFSQGDISTALGYNAKEFRAKGTTRTYSIKRPSTGWPDTSKVVQAYKSTYAKTPAGPSRQHETMKSVAKQFGLDYTWN